MSRRRVGNRAGSAMRYANIQTTAFATASTYAPVGAKVLAVQGYDDDNPTCAFTLYVSSYNRVGTAICGITYTFNGVRNGAWVNVAGLTWPSTNMTAAPAAAGDLGVATQGLGGTNVRMRYAS